MKYKQQLIILAFGLVFLISGICMSLSTTHHNAGVYGSSNVTMATPNYDMWMWMSALIVGILAINYSITSIRSEAKRKTEQDAAANP